MDDIVPGLLDTLRKQFGKNVSSSKEIAELLRDIKNGAETYLKAEEYAKKVGEALSEAFGLHLSSEVLPDGRMYFNIADRTIRPLLVEGHELVTDATVQVQTTLNARANIGIKAQTALINTDRIDGIIQKVADAEYFDDVAWMLGEPVVNFSMSIVDKILQANIEFQGKSGLQPSVTRTSTGKCCDWCNEVAGKYAYPDVPEDVYKRHQRCDCLVEYDPGDGRRQNAHTKKWRDETTEELLEARQTIGLKKDQQPYDIRGIKKPERPSFRDYPGGTTDETFIRDRAAYKRNRETYDELMDQQVDRALKREFKYDTPESVLAAGRERGIEIDPRFFDGKNDLRAFDEMFESYDELRKKYPQAMKYEYDYEGRKIPAGVNRIMKSEGDSGQWYYAGFEGDTLRLGDGLLESYEDNMRKYLGSITEGHFSEGTGTYKNLFNHEFGHNVDTYIQNTIRSGKEVTQYLPELTEYQNGLKKIYADYGPPSEYGGANLDEFFAETFSAYEGGEQTELTRAFSKFLEGWL